MVKFWEASDQSALTIDFTNISRVTLVDERGRVYERYNLSVVADVQDDGRTLKLFVDKR